MGRPKGKTMLSGCIAIPVYDSDRKITYYGIRIKDQKPIFHKSFNPELYLYNYHRVNPDKEIHFTTDMLECIRLIGSDIPAVCNFGLPYLSKTHLELLQKCKYVSLMCDNGNLDEIRKQFFESFNNYIRFIKPAIKSHQT